MRWPDGVARGEAEYARELVPEGALARKPRCAGTSSFPCGKRFFPMQSQFLVFLLFMVGVHKRSVFFFLILWGGGAGGHSAGERMASGWVDEATKPVGGRGRAVSKFF